MEVETCTPSEESFSSESNSRVGSFCRKTFEAECDRADGSHFFPRTPFLSTKERYRRTSCDSGLIRTKSVNPLPHFSDDYCEPSTASVTKERLCNINRLEGRVVACSNSSFLPTVSGVQAGPENLSFQEYAVWPQCGTQNFYKAGKRASERIETRRNSDSHISRRYSDLGGFGGFLYRSERPGSYSTSNQRFHSKFSKITSDSQSNFHLARPGMESSLAHLETSRGEDNTYARSPPRDSPQISDFQASSREDNGSAEFRFHIKSTHFHSNQNVESESAVVCPSVSQGSELSHGDGAQTKIGHSRQGSHSQWECSFEDSRLFSHNDHRLLPTWVGSTYGGQMGSGNMASEISRIPYKYTGAHSSVSWTERTFSSSRNAYFDSNRQYFSHVMYTKEWFSEVVPSQSVDVLHSSNVSQEEMEIISGAHSGNREHMGRRFVEKQTDQHGMVPGSRSLRKDTANGPPSESGPICVETQSSATALCVPDDRSTGSGKGCILPRLEPLASDLSLSPDEHDFEGFEETGALSRCSLPSSSSLAESSVVSWASEHVQMSLSSENNSRADDWRKNLVRYLKSEQKPTRLDFLMKVFTQQYSQASAEDMIQYLRPSSQRQYNSVWNAWRDHFKESGSNEVKAESILSFLRSMFHERGLATNTLWSYKAALKLPMLLGFGIDLNGDPFDLLLKAFALKRPVRPSSVPTWSLNNVLELLSSEKYRDPKELKIFTAKVMFLISLALGSRVSELCALRRGNFVKFLPSGELELTPDPKFLAKNEDPLERRLPRRISPLEGNNSLCPVATLRDYLRVTTRHESPSLFIHPNGKDRWTPTEARKVLCKLIREANPNSWPKSHDIRKMASSYAFFGAMNFQSISSFTGWSSVGVFVRHYLNAIEDLRQPCVVLGRNIQPPAQ